MTIERVNLIKCILVAGIIPEFLGKLDETQYGVENLLSKIYCTLRAYPAPIITWFFRGQKLEMGDKYSCTLASSGELALEIANFQWSDCGEYKIHIENDYGSATQIFTMEMAGRCTILLVVDKCLSTRNILDMAVEYPF